MRFIPRARRHHHRLYLQVEEPVHLPVRIRVRPAHEAVADQTDVKLASSHSVCLRGQPPACTARVRLPDLIHDAEDLRWLVECEARLELPNYTNAELRRIARRGLPCPHNPITRHRRGYLVEDRRRLHRIDADAVDAEILSELNVLP